MHADPFPVGVTQVLRLNMSYVRDLENCIQPLTSALLLFAPNTSFGWRELAQKNVPASLSVRSLPGPSGSALRCSSRTSRRRLRPWEGPLCSHRRSLEVVRPCFGSEVGCYPVGNLIPLTSSARTRILGTRRRTVGTRRRTISRTTMTMTMAERSGLESTPEPGSGGVQCSPLPGRGGAA